MKQLKVMTIIGTRPEIIRLSEIIKTCDKVFNHILVHTGQNWDYHLNDIFFKDLSLRPPDFYLNSVGEHLGMTIGNIIQKSYELFIQEKPDALLILGDTNSALAAIPAKRLKIPIFHMEAGNRCFDQNLPEEINRRIIDHIADINLPYTEHARRYLLAEGIRGESIFVTGSPLPEVIAAHQQGIVESNILTQLQLTPQNYFLVSAHREENIDHSEHFNRLMTSLNAVAEHYKLPIIFSTHPRTALKLESTHFTLHPLIQKLKPLSFIDYNALQQTAFCVLSDSGTLGEETSLLHFPAVSLRTSTERPEVLDQGHMILGGITPSLILNSIDLARFLLPHRTNALPSDYADFRVSTKIVSLIQSYTPIINEMIWRKTLID